MCDTDKGEERGVTRAGCAGRRALMHFVLYPVIVIVITFTIFTSAYFSFGTLEMLAGAPLDVRGLPGLGAGSSGTGGAGAGEGRANVMVLNNSASDLSPLLSALRRQHLALFTVESQVEYDDILGIAPFLSP